jgi:hypothetical protein
VAQAVEHLLCKHKTLSSTPSKKKKNPPKKKEKKERNLSLCKKEWKEIDTRNRGT